MRFSIIKGKKEKVMYTVTKYLKIEFLEQRLSRQVDIGCIAEHGNIAPG
jgi:hypothetical protein